MALCLVGNKSMCHTETDFQIMPLNREVTVSGFSAFFDTSEPSVCAALHRPDEKLMNYRCFNHALSSSEE